MTSEEFLLAYKEGKRDFRYVDMTGADMRGADMTDVDMTGADMRGADMRYANMTGANIDYSSFSLSCSFLNIKIDKRIAAQLMYHVCSMDCDDPDFIKARNSVLDFANTFHRVNECGKLFPKKEEENVN